MAIRLWTPALHRGLAAFDRPEMLEAELSSLVLDCAAWGTPPAELAFLDPPPPGALAAAGALLRELGALDDAGGITEAGRRMARLGAHPRLAAMLLAAETDAEAALAADLAALLEERDPLRGPPDARRTHRPTLPPRIAAITDGDPAADRGAAGPHPPAPPRSIAAGCACRRTRARQAIRAGCWRPASPTASPSGAASRAASACPAAAAPACRAPTSWPTPSCSRWRRWRCSASAQHPPGRAARPRGAARRPRRAGHRDRRRPASTRSPARCWRAGGAGSARWCCPTARCRPTRRRPPPPWPAPSPPRPAPTALDRGRPPAAGPRRPDARASNPRPAGRTCPTPRWPPRAEAWLAPHLPA